MQKKEFIKPEMKKCEQPLDKVTLQLGCYRRDVSVIDDGPFTTTKA